MKVPAQKSNHVSGKPGRVAGKKKLTKQKVASSEEETEDVSVVGTSLMTSVRGVKDLIQAINVGTREDLLVNECSLIYECRVCKNLFRSVANFISHKRAYCKKSYQYFNYGFFNGLLESKSQMGQTVEVEPEPSPQTHSTDTDWFKEGETSTKSRRKNSFPETTAELQRSPPVKLLGRILWPNVKKDTPVRNSRPALPQDRSILCRLEGMQGSDEAVFQTIISEETKSPTSIQQELSDLQLSSKAKEAVILADGHVAKPAGSYCCSSCDASFPSERMLERHATVYHNPRTCYPCPICKVFLTTPWGVYRHLSKLHHKSEEQIRRLRPQILQRAKNRNLYQASKPVNDALDAEMAKMEAREEEKWMAQFEGELHCTVCGKSFSRRAALTVHSAKCKVVVPKNSKLDLEPVGPQICEKCGLVFTRKAVLSVHSQTCKGLVNAKAPTSHPCSYCGRPFARRRALTLHLVKCPKAPTISPRSPLSLLLTPPKLTPIPSNISPSAIVIRRDYCKPSPLTLNPRCFCPERCAIHPPLPSRLEAVVKKLQERSTEITADSRSSTTCPNPKNLELGTVSTLKNDNQTLISPRQSRKETPMEDSEPEQAEEERSDNEDMESYDQPEDKSDEDDEIQIVYFSSDKNPNFNREECPVRPSAVVSSKSPVNIENEPQSPKSSSDDGEAEISPIDDGIMELPCDEESISAASESGFVIFETPPDNASILVEPTVINLSEEDLLQGESSGRATAQYDSSHHVESEECTSESEPLQTVLESSPAAHAVLEPAQNRLSPSSISIPRTKSPILEPSDSLVQSNADGVGDSEHGQGKRSPSPVFNSRSKSPVPQPSDRPVQSDSEGVTNNEQEQSKRSPLPVFIFRSKSLEPSDKLVLSDSIAEQRQSKSFSLSPVFAFREKSPVPEVSDSPVEFDIISLTSKSYATDRSDAESPYDGIASAATSVTTFVEEMEEDSGVSEDCPPQEVVNRDNLPFLGFELTDIIYDSVLFRMKKLVQTHEEELEVLMRSEEKGRKRYLNGAVTRRGSGSKNKKINRSSCNFLL